MSDISTHRNDPAPSSPLHPRTVGWFGTTAVAMGGINQSLFLLGALFIGQGDIPGQGSAAVVLLGVGLLLAWMATPGWTELILMYPNRVGGIAATCAEAFRPYSPVLANLTGVCYWWGWVPTCGLTALLASSAINQWYWPDMPVPLLAVCIVMLFTVVNLCGVKWVMRFSMPIATASALLAFASAVIPVYSGSVDWQQAFTFKLTVPFDGWFGELTSIMAGLYLIGFAAPAFEQAACHVGETINPNKNVPRAMFASAALASLYFIALPIIWLGTLGPEPMARELALELGPTFAPLLGGAAKAAAIWFMIFNMLHGTMAPLAGASRTLAQLSEDGLLPESLAKRSRTDAPWVATLLTAGMSIVFLLIGDPIWLIAAANLTYLIGIAMPSVAVWLLRRNEPDLPRPYRASRVAIMLGLCAAGVWALTVILGFQQFGLRTVLIGIVFAYSGSALYAWRKFSDRRKQGLPGIARTLHLKLTGAMLIVLMLDAAGYLIAVDHVPKDNAALIAMLEDIFVAVALLTIAVGLILPGMIAHSAVQVSIAAEKLVSGTLADFTRAMRALGSGDLDSAKASMDLQPVKVYSYDEVGDMALNFNKLQEEIARAAAGLDGAREGLSQARKSITEANRRLSAEQEALIVSLREKEALLKEVHHRVKNNLQVITSLLRLESGRIEHSVTKAVLQDMQARIRSMSLLHEAIYSTGSFAQVDMAAYLSQLATQLFRSLAIHPSRVALKLELAPIHLGLDQAILCGMIVNELASNCLKHGFPDGASGEVKIELQPDGGGRELLLRVSDNGIDLPEGFERNMGNSLGLQLVGDLTGQMQGQLTIGPNHAAVFCVRFTPSVPSGDVKVANNTAADTTKVDTTMAYTTTAAGGTRREV
ncbi:MAG: amino acid permease [Burkholderiales bacterium]